MLNIVDEQQILVVCVLVVCVVVLTFFKFSPKLDVCKPDIKYFEISVFGEKKKNSCVKT